MTSLTFNISRALALTCQPGDRIVVSRLDHDANISPWLRVAEDRGCQVVWVDFDPEDCTLSLASLEHALEQKPHLVAVGYASNAVGTINPVKRITEMAHAVGSLVYIDAVQYAPHGPIDVQDIGCDFLVCSAYKYFGPHVGVLYGRYELLDELRAYRVRPAPQDPPGKFETGTGNFEGYAGVLGALEYLAWLGNAFGAEQIEKYDGQYHGRRLVFKQVMSAIRAYEYELSRAFLDVLSGIPGLRLYGQDDPRQLEKRVPTFAFRLRDVSPRHTAEHLARSYINVTDGNYYALAVTERLGVEASGGMVRAGAVHYNTVDEVHQLGEGLEKIVTTPL